MVRRISRKSDWLCYCTAEFGVFKLAIKSIFVQDKVGRN